jgi:hypothetical protein
MSVAVMERDAGFGKSQKSLRKCPDEPESVLSLSRDLAILA